MATTGRHVRGTVGFTLDGTEGSVPAVERALATHLCRCTGWRCGATLRGGPPAAADRCSPPTSPGDVP